MPEQWEAWFTGATIVTMIGAIAFGRAQADIIVVGALMLLLVAGVISPTDAAAGFGNTTVLTIAFLYIVAAGLKETGAIGYMSNRILGRPQTAFQAQSRLVLPIAFTSAFANNTPIVASFLPVLSALSRRTGIPVGKLFMPLSFAAILGGLCTLIGTATTLIVKGQLEDFQRMHADTISEPETFDFFTITPVGLPVALVGLTYILLFGRLLLPGNRTSKDSEEVVRQYMAALRVEEDAAIVGKTIEQADLRHLPGLFLSRIDRGDETIIAVEPDTALRAGDVLVFVGQLSSLVDLRQRRGLVPASDDADPAQAPSPGYRPDLRLIEAVVSSNSPLVGRTVRDAGIRTRYSAVVVAVQRLGHQLRGKIGDIVLRPGDTLLLETNKGFSERFRSSSEFYLVSETAQNAAPRHEKALMAIGIVTLFVILLGTGILEPMAAAMLAAGLMVLTRCCRGPQARRSIDWTVLAVIGAAMGIGRAVDQSGLGTMIAEPLAQWAPSLGAVGMLIVIYMMTNIFTTFMTHSAAAALVCPIAFQFALAADFPLLPVGLCIAIAASAEFTTPIGYQTNLMVMGPGNYRFLDYARFGGPLTIISAIVAITSISLIAM
ncbi:MAG: SLC13 family permease [Planctomycetota bacterium]